MSVTIKDIAERANISYPSVSRALSGKPGVSEKTREKVLKIAAEMDYRPNALARSLVENKTSSLGLIIPDILNPFFPAIAKGVDDGAHEKGYSVFLSGTDWDPDREQEYIRQLLAKRVDGLIIFPSSEERIDHIRELAGDEIPLILLGTDRSCDHGLSISIDNVRGAELAAGHLLDRGCRDLAFIGGQKGRSGVQSRLEGFIRAHKSRGLEVNEKRILMSGFSFDGGRKALVDLMDGGDSPDGVFAENDMIALGVLEAVRTRGLEVPEDLALCGFDDIPMASIYGIELTTVRQPKYEMGKLAVEQLISLLEEKNGQGPARRIVLEPELIIRKTS